MTTSSSPRQGFPWWARLARPSLLLLGVAVPAAAMTALAFGTARGIVRVSEFTYDTDQLVVNPAWWWAAYLLAVPVYVAALAHPRLAVVGVLVASVPQWYTAHRIVVGFAEAGWGDGLETFAYAWAGVMTFAFACAATLGALTRGELRFRRRLMLAPR